MLDLKNILVATDFGNAAATALKYGRDLARQHGATLHVLYVEDISSSYAANIAPLLMTGLQKLEQAMQVRAAALLTNEDRRVLRARAIVRASTSPSLAIVDYARAHEIDLIVMGTQGRGAMSRILRGSVAARVVRTAPCPVLTVRDAEREFVAPDELAVIAQV
jgi:nucleotide-binding universal stress UspA family protein